jgi:hypothetical protein
MAAISAGFSSGVLAGNGDAIAIYASLSMSTLRQRALHNLNRSHLHRKSKVARKPLD